MSLLFLQICDFFWIGLPCFLPTDPPITTTPSPIINYRLPRNLEAEDYTVRLRPNIYGGNPEEFNFTGSVTIEMKCTEATSYIILHKRQIDVTDASVAVVTLPDLNPIEVRDTSFDEDTEFFWIQLARTLAVDEQIRVYMDYSGPLNKDMAGMFWTDYYEGGVRRSVFCPKDKVI